MFFDDQGFANDFMVGLVNADCSCGRNQGTLLNLAFNFDQFRIELFRKYLDHFHRDLLRCRECEEEIPREKIGPSFLGYSFPDGSGSVVGWFDVVRDAFRFGYVPEKDMLAIVAQAPETITDLVDEPFDSLINRDCFRKLGRVLSIKSRWAEMFMRHGENPGPALEPVAPGYYLGICENGLRDELQKIHEELPNSASMASLAINGLDDWPDEQKRDFLPGAYPTWMPERFKLKIQNDEVSCFAFIDLVELASTFHTHALDRGLEVLEMPELEELHSHEIKLRSRRGVTAKIGAASSFLSAIYHARTLGEAVEIMVGDGFDHLGRMDRLADLIETETGGVRVTEEGIAHFKDQQMNLYSLAAKFDLEDDEQRGRLVKWIKTGKSCECKRYASKKLKRRDWLPEKRSPLHRTKGKDFAVVYARECEHDVAYGSDLFNSDVEEAEVAFQRDMDKNQWAGPLLVGGEVFAFIAPNAASVAIHPGFVGELIRQADLEIGPDLAIFAPSSGVLVFGEEAVDREELRKFGRNVEGVILRQMGEAALGEPLDFIGTCKMGKPRGTVEIEEVVELGGPAV